VAYHEERVAVHDHGDAREEEIRVHAASYEAGVAFHVHAASYYAEDVHGEDHASSVEEEWVVHWVLSPGAVAAVSQYFVLAVAVLAVVVPVA
jgi:hypothetical protein